MSPSVSEFRRKRDQQLRVSVDVGTDAPLMTTDTRLRVPDRRHVNMRWFAGTVLTGITSVVLMGGALFAAIDATHESAQPTGALSGSLIQGGQPISQSASTLANSGKGNRFRPEIKEKPARRVIQVSTVNREGNRDFIRVKPFVHIKAPLALETSDRISEIPNFNPLTVYTEDQPDARQEALPIITTAKVDGEISIQVRPFPLAMGAVDTAVLLSEADVMSDINEIGRFLNGEDANAISVAAMNPQGIGMPDVGSEPVDLANAPMADPFNITIIPENVSFIEKYGDTGGNFSYEERIVDVAEGDTLSGILAKHDADQTEVASAVDALINAHAITQIKPGQKIRIAIATAEDGSNRVRPVRVSIYQGREHLGSVALNDSGEFVGAAEPYLEADLGEIADAKPIPGQLPTLYDSLYETGLSLEMPQELVADVVRIFTYDLDFQKRITPSDSISVLHSTPNAGSDENGHVLFAEVTLAGNTKQFYRFRTPDDGFVDYYDDSGRSAKKFLMRKPVAKGAFRSPFGMRKHPITGVFKMHTGVDWSTGRGTPIYAAGDGTVKMAKWNGGYGRHIRLQHANRYETTYSHMSKIASGIKAGARVRQGQLIGYVGSTGFSTGPHLHYEVLVNKRPVNPMKIKLPRGRVLKGEMLAKFHEERQRITSLIALNEEATVAAASN
ncbi:M23 family metallopeptidase [Pararhizobium sp. IMCC21322]|uniref:M23 family metallopeptidase n=1 Tax=Pararhizobium sp. IMCC21322 TaxID=3067903 RepID=UPI002740E037|nr:M23 family metallopeptidase [Pararhizobium sp. IMCC21322]